MKTKHYLIIGVLGIALTGVLFTSCKKKSSEPAQNNPAAPKSPDMSAATDDANASFAIQDSKNIADGAAKGQAEERMMSGCETFSYGGHTGKFDTIIGGNNDSALWINFGPNDCVCLDNRKRKGQIFVYWTHTLSYFDPAGTISMTFQNYYVNDIQFTGIRTLTNNGANCWSYTASLQFTYPNNGGTATWNTTRKDTIVTDSTVSYWKVTGSASGTSRTGQSFTLTISQPIYFTVLPWWFFGCAWIEAGYVSINVTGLQYPLYVNFGSYSRLGPHDCHATDTIIYNNVKYPFLQL